MASRSLYLENNLAILQAIEFMKITVVCHEIPYPPIHGGRIDMWRRLKAFSHFGVDLQLICWWYDTPPTHEEIAEINKYVKQLCIVPIKRTLGDRVRRIVDLLYYPLEVTSRIIRGKQLNSLLYDVRAFNPDVILLDGIHGGEIATALSKRLNVPLFTRSHNIEHLYYRRMLASARGLKNKIKRFLSVINLEKYEKNLLKNSTLFYDISADDLKFWQSQGYSNGRWLPPLVEFPEYSTTPKYPIYDLVFLGNLSLENNAAGVVWFLNDVIPIIRANLPKIRVLIAGLNPGKEIKQLCEEVEGVDLSINPVSAVEIYQSGRVLINPVLKGSGVKIKSIEMLIYGKPLVSTPEGVSGLPEEVRQYFKIAADAQSFAAEVIKALSNSVTTNADRELLESMFGYKVIEGVVSDIKALKGL